MHSHISKKALFLDRDGVINHDPGDYTKSLAEFVLLPTILQKMKLWFDEGYLLFVITNQGGLAKQLYSENEVMAMHQYVNGECIFRDFHITEFFYCPHHEAYSGRCFCRKPGSLMIEKALHRYKLNASECLMIGDRQRDIDCANAAGVEGVLIETNSEIPTPEEWRKMKLMG